MYNNTFAHTSYVIDNVRVNNALLAEIMFILKAIKPHFKESYDKQNLTLMVISYKFMKGSFHKFHMKRPLV